MNNLSAVAPPMSWNKIESIALQLQRVYAPQVLATPQPFPIVDLLRFDLEPLTGAVCRVEDLDSSREAVTIYDQRYDRLEIVLSEETDAALDRGYGRAFMTGAHECGHVFLHHQQVKAAGGRLPPPPGLFRTKDKIPPYQNPERQAEVFAGRLLIPAAALRLAIQQYGLDVHRLADTFQVSYSAIGVRLREIGVA